MLDEAIEGKFGAICPDSSVWLGQLDSMWQDRNPGSPPLVGTGTSFAESPVVVAMWESTAYQMGYPGAAIGWQSMMNVATHDADFKWSHPSAAKTASGLLTVTAECYSAAGKSAGLTMGDLEAETTLEYIQTIERTVERYGGESEDKVVIRILGEGGYPLDAFITQEQMVIYFNRNTEGENLVAIYPDEGTFMMDHPLALLEGSWVTEEQRLAFQAFADFVTQPEQQRLVLSQGYRPSVSTDLIEGPDSLIKPEYRVDPAQPHILLEVPSPDLMVKIEELWHLAKKRANIYLVADVSGSMKGEKIDEAKVALLSFVDQIESDLERVALLQFSDSVRERVPLNTLDINRASLKDAIQTLSATGGTALYDATAYAFQELQELDDTERINVVLVMTDGMNTAGQLDLSSIVLMIQETDIPILAFCVGYGADADMDALTRISRVTDARAYPADPETINKLYELLSAFF